MSSRTPQSLGGDARAQRLSQKARKEIASRAAQARWAKVKDPNRLPEAISDGHLQIGEVMVEVYLLDDKRRVLSMRAMGRALGMKSEGGNVFARTLGRKGIGSVLPEKLLETVNNPIYFKPLTGDLSYGFEAETLIEVCDAIIEARNQGKLTKSQAFLGIQSEIILRSAAKIGIIALIDEALGYTDRRRDEYRALFKDFVASEVMQWKDEYPDKFFDMIYNLYGLKRKDPSSTKHPQFFGHFIRRFVYSPLANSRGVILEMLDEQNPVVYANGGRRYKMYQFLTEQVGIDALRQHLWQVVGIGSACRDRKQFERAFFRAFPEAIPMNHQFDLLSDYGDDA